MYHRLITPGRGDGPMKFCVYGAGAIGGYLAVDLALSGHELGRLTGVSTPMVDAVLALVQEGGRAAGLYAPLEATR
jgi:ketopantoate reductase